MKKEVNKEVQALFINPGALLNDHLREVERDFDGYWNEFMSCYGNKFSFSSGCKPRVLVSMWITRRMQEVDLIFNLDGFLEVPDVLKAVNILDAPREARQLEKRLVKLEEAKAKKNKLIRVRQDIDNLSREPHKYTCTSSFVKRIVQWVNNIPAETLEFYLLAFPVDTWKELADKCHFNPLHFKLDYFLPCIFGKQAPEGSFVNMCQNLTNDNVMEMFKAYPKIFNMYSFLRKQIDPKTLPVVAKVELVNKMPLEEILWFYDEIHTNNGMIAFEERLKNEKEIESIRGKGNYAKIMERLLLYQNNHYTFADRLIPFAEDMLKSKVALGTDKKVVVLGDASASMDIAIKVSTIIASCLCALYKAELVFYSGSAIYPESNPKTVQEVLQVCRTIRTVGCTSAAAAFKDYYIQKKKVDLVIVVTDEYDNTKSGGYMFVDMYKKYLEEVNPKCTILFVSFRSSTDGKILGQMVKGLLDRNITAKFFPMNMRNPDLTKFPSIQTIIQKVLVDEVDAGSDKPDKNEEAPRDDRYLCSVCLENEKNVLFMPCKHQCCCNQCSPNVQQCPLCMTEITEKIDVYV